MRYVLILDALGVMWAKVMKERGVERSTVDAWMTFYYEKLIQASTGESSKIPEVAEKIARSFLVANYYIRKAEEE